MEPVMVIGQHAQNIIRVLGPPRAPPSLEAVDRLLQALPVITKKKPFPTTYGNNENLNTVIP